MLKVAVILLHFVALIAHCTARKMSDDDHIKSSFEIDTASARISRRIRREPAVWGEPAPDYSNTVLDGYTRYLRALLFVDSKISNHYNNDIPQMKAEVSKMVKEANDYFFQMNIRIIIVDVLQTKRSDLSLYAFEDYRSNRMSILPEHDFAALISYRYAGGLAFVSGMCTSKAVMLCGFYPHNPMAMGSIFFHEVAHLLGVPHRNASEALDIPKCYCDSLDPSERSKGTAGCLKIPGYDHDCTAQQLANVLHKNKCLKKQANALAMFAPLTVEESLPICGNGVKEKGEECDCGLERYCSNRNCRAKECTQIIKTWQLYLTVGVLSVVLLASLSVFIYNRASHICIRRYFRSSSMCACHLTEILCFNCGHWSRGKHYQSSMRRAGNTISSTNLYDGKRGKLNASNIVVLIDANNSDRLVRRHSSITRPSRPPPPPPISAQDHMRKLRDREGLHLNLGEVSRPKKPPPVPAKPPHLISKAMNIDSNDIYEIPNSERAKYSYAPNDHNQEEFPQQNDLRSEMLDSISRKFDDFDDDFDEDDTDQVPYCESTVQYTPILPRKEFTLSSDALQKPKSSSFNGGLCSDQNEASSRSKKISAPSMILCRNLQAREVERVKREESFSSNESSENRNCVSDDTGSTGLSEEDDKSISVANAIHRFNEKSWLI